MTSIKGPISFDQHGNFLDSSGRVVQLKGINIDGGCKFPQTPYLPSYVPLGKGEEEQGDSIFFDGDNVSFVGRPWPLKDVEYHINRLKSMGFNTIRYIITWEALEHAGPGVYDMEFIEYTIEVLKIIHNIGGVFIYLDPHQDVWSRFSGGDGAPMWTLYAAGFDPKSIKATEGAILENHYEEHSQEYHKMIWATNYLRLVAGTMFVLFFAGKVYAPKATINGVNIQDYLQDHFINSFRFLLNQITERAPEILHGTLLGVETMNEPNAGYLGYPDISQHPETQELRLGTCPTLLDSLKLGAGFKVTVDEYRVSIAGPRKIGTKTIDPQGQSIWLATDRYDKKYGFVRGSEWELGKCLWEQHGVWDSQTGKAVRSKYFSVDQLNGEPVDEKYYINTFFIDHYKKYREAMRSAWSEGIMFLQPPPLELPPDLKNTDLIDNKTVFCPHYYDGCSLLFKTWNRVYNVNTLAIMRRRYVNPIFSVILGERKIRNSIRNQLAEMKQESKDHIGESVPVLFTEIGMPFDMDEKWAYKEGRGDFSSQRDALDALAFALEGSNLSHTWWCYTASNSHEHGDGFNGEDFSFWSKDDTTWSVATAAKEIYLASEYEGDFSYDQDTLRKQNSTVEFHRYLANTTDEESNSNSNNNDFGDTAPGSSSSSNGTHQSTAPTLNNAGVTEYSQFNKSRFSNTRSSQANEEETEDPRAPALMIGNLSSTSKDTYDGLRAIDSIIRPYAVAINGDFKFAEFDLSQGSYILQIIGRKNSSNVPTKVYIPEWHYEPDQALVEITSGYFKTNANKEMDDVGVIEEEILEWYHGSGEQTLIIKDLKGKESNGRVRGRGRTHGIVGSLMSWILPCYF